RGAAAAPEERQRAGSGRRPGRALPSPTSLLPSPRPAHGGTRARWRRAAGGCGRRASFPPLSSRPPAVSWRGAPGALRTASPRCWPGAGRRCSTSSWRCRAPGTTTATGGLKASILDLHSGALSLGKQFVNLYRYFGDKIQGIFTEEDFALYRDVRQRIQQKIAQAFGISSSSMYLTKPTFFSRINSTEAKTTHDEYWHPHIDKVTYGSFDYTSLLYLSDYAEDFGGGRFVFMDAGSNKTIEPQAGRVSFFTSGSENLHRVEKVHWGTRYAITISFTCNPDHGIGDPVLM
uniref:2-oxoglutarate and iron dependent oxygenase domain containing 3 n=1 Tax=Gallus gallus TaxID=9031 RepID=A0A8V1AM93_CHICK